jgi:hypothetical protein
VKEEEGCQGRKQERTKGEAGGRRRKQEMQEAGGSSGSRRKEEEGGGRKTPRLSIPPGTLQTQSGHVVRQRRL